MQPFCLALCSFGLPSHAVFFLGYHLKWGGVLLHDAVGVNCKKGATTENQDAGVKYIGQV